MATIERGDKVRIVKPVESDYFDIGAIGVVTEISDSKRMPYCVNISVGRHSNSTWWCYTESVELHSKKEIQDV